MSDTSDLKSRWWDWHKANPDVWRLFEAFTFEALNRGVTHLSGWLIVNRIRWESAVTTKGDDFKISNDFVALYVRLFQARHPHLAHVFTTKPMKRLGEKPRAEGEAA